MSHEVIKMAPLLLFTVFAIQTVNVPEPLPSESESMAKFLLLASAFMLS